MGYCPTGKHLAHEAHPPTEGPPVAYPPAEEQIETRLGRLTLEQKVGLLTGADTWALKTEPAIGLGRMVLSDGPSGVRGELWDERDPSLNLPSATALAATWDPDVAYRYGAAMAAEAHRKGVHVVLGPTINLHRSPLGGRHFEAYSEDPELTSVIAEAFVRGLQDHGVGACPKHYVANDFETERFSASVAVSERALRELYLVPFERSVAAGAWTIMSAYNGVDGQSALVARTQGGGSATVVPESTVAPLDGLRAAWPDATITHALGAVVHSGIFPLEPSTITDPESGESGMRARFFAADGAVLLDEHRGGAELVWLGNAPREAARLELVADLRPERSGPVELGLQSVGHCILELDDEVLLDVRLATDTLDLGAALLFPPHRTTRVELTAGQVYRLRVVSRLAEDISRPPGLAALTVGSRPVDEAAEVLVDEAVRVAAAADVAIVVVGTNAQVESEGFDRSSLALPGHQDALVHAVAAANPRTVVVVNSGSPVLMPWRHEVAAIVLTWFGGEQYGHALADVLSGAVEPGGRLPTTWPGTEADVPVLDVRPTDGVLRYDEGIHIGYRAWQRIGRVR